jgi:hypothetical protein
MEYFDKLFALPWLAWVLLAVTMVVTVLSTEYLKPLCDKCRVKVPGLLLFWVVGIALFAGLHFIHWLKFGPAPVMVYIVLGGALNIAYYKDFLRLRTIVRKLILGEVPIPDAEEK